MKLHKASMQILEKTGMALNGEETVYYLKKKIGKR